MNEHAASCREIITAVLHVVAKCPNPENEMCAVGEYLGKMGLIVSHPAGSQRYNTFASGPLPTEYFELAKSFKDNLITP